MRSKRRSSLPHHYHPTTCTRPHSNNSANVYPKNNWHNTFNKSRTPTKTCYSNNPNAKKPLPPRPNSHLISPTKTRPWSGGDSHKKKSATYGNLTTASTTPTNADNTLATNNLSRNSLAHSSNHNESPFTQTITTKLPHLQHQSGHATDTHHTYTTENQTPTLTSSQFHNSFQNST